MGKIVDALKVAHGEVAELVLKSLEETEIVEHNGNGNGNGKVTAAAAPAEEPKALRIPLPWLTTEPAEATRAAAAPMPVETPVVEPAPAPASKSEPVVGRWQIRVLPLEITDGAPLLSAKPVHGSAAEQYRFVRTRIMHHTSASGTMAISSPGIGDGKSVTAINLAGAFAQTGDEEVLLIDGDLRCSAVHGYLQVPQSPGLSEVLSGKCSLQEAIFRVAQIPGLCILPAGSPASNPTELLGSSRWPALLKTLRQEFHRVIVDCPPVEAVADYDLIARDCDAALLVVRPDHTNRGLCVRAIEKTRKKLLGVLINCTADRALLKQYMSYYHDREEKKA
jgi:protein-tyrosine kinase